MNSLPRWLISITDMPLPCQSSISSAHRRSTGSGRTAGPGLKLKGRVMATIIERLGRRRARPEATTRPKGRVEIEATRGRVASEALLQH